MGMLFMPTKKPAGATETKITTSQLLTKTRPMIAAAEPDGGHKKHATPYGSVIITRMNGKSEVVRFGFDGAHIQQRANALAALGDWERRQYACFPHLDPGQAMWISALFNDSIRSYRTCPGRRVIFGRCWSILKTS